jgi:GTPase SAR1 family protein
MKKVSPRSKKYEESKSTKVTESKCSKEPSENPKPLNVPKPIVPITEPPVDSIRVCMLGCVSAGKTTTLEALFLSEQRLSQTGMKRTTMVPTIFVESDQPPATDIFQVIESKNKDLISRSEKGEPLTLADCTELLFSVGNLDMAINDPIAPCTVYDIPGMNDARTKTVYYEYIKNTFAEFNIIMFIVDINSGLNTSDEMDIVHLIASKTKDCQTKYNKEIYTIVLVNKVDDVEFENGEIILRGELKDMFEQVVQTINGEFIKADVHSNLIDVIPMCSNDAYLYRMVAKYGDRFVLTEEQINKIGINEQGKRFTKLPMNEREACIKDIIHDQTFVTDMIQSSGFHRVKQKLNSVYQTHGVRMLLDNANYELNKLQPIHTIIDGQALATIECKSNVIMKIGTILTKMISISPSAESTLFAISMMTTNIHNSMKTKISKYTSYDAMMMEFSKFRTQLNTWLLNTIFIHVYPDYIIDKSIELIIAEVNNAFDPNKFTRHIMILKKMNQPQQFNALCNVYGKQYERQIEFRRSNQLKEDDTTIDDLTDLYKGYLILGDNAVQQVSMYRMHVLYLMCNKFSSRTLRRIQIEILKPNREFHLSTFIDVYLQQQDEVNTLHFMSSESFTVGPQFDFIRKFCDHSRALLHVD